MNAFSSHRLEFVIQRRLRPSEAHNEAGALLKPSRRFVACGDWQGLRKYHGRLRPVTGQEFSREGGGRHGA